MRQWPRICIVGIATAYAFFLFKIYISTRIVNSANSHPCPDRAQVCDALPGHDNERHVQQHQRHVMSCSTFTNCRCVMRLRGMMVSMTSDKVSSGQAWPPMRWKTAKSKMSPQVTCRDVRFQIQGRGLILSCFAFRSGH